MNNEINEILCLSSYNNWNFYTKTTLDDYNTKNIIYLKSKGLLSEFYERLIFEIVEDYGTLIHCGYLNTSKFKVRKEYIINVLKYRNRDKFISAHINKHYPEMII